MTAIERAAHEAGITIDQARTFLNALRNPEEAAILAGIVGGDNDPQKHGWPEYFELSMAWEAMIDFLIKETQ